MQIRLNLAGLYFIFEILSTVAVIILGCCSIYLFIYFIMSKNRKENEFSAQQEESSDTSILADAETNYQYLNYNANTPKIFPDLSGF